MPSSDKDKPSPKSRTRTKPLTVVRRAWSAWKRLTPFLHGSRLALSLLTIVSVLTGLAEAGLLALIAAVAAALSTSESEVSADLGPVNLDAGVNTVLAVGFAIAVFRGGLQILTAYIPARLGAKATTELRRRLFDSFTRAAWAIKSTERDGHFQSLMNAHITSTTTAIINVGNGASAMITFLTMLVSAFLLDPPAALALTLCSAALFVVLRPLAQRLRRYAKSLSHENIEYSKGVQEIVLIAEETEVFGATNTYRDSVYRTIENVRIPLFRTRFLAGAVPAIFQSVALLLLILALFVVSSTNVGPVATLGAVVLILFRTMNYGQQVQTALTGLDERIPFMNRLAAAIQHYEDNPQQDGVQPLPRISSIGLRGVHFAYDREKPSLTDVSFTVDRGEAVGIAGPSGAGKSTIVQILLRLREPSQGALVVNGADAHAYRRRDWQERVAYVPQTPQLIWGTVADNIRFFRDSLSQDDLEAAAHQANIHDDIMSWPRGYDTVVGQRASAVSGGQRQRLCLARALAGRPEVLILDEATSALDVKSEALIHESLQQLKGHVTLFSVSHRVSTLSLCDRVIVVIGGRLQAVETPAVLSVGNDFYREITRITDAHAT